MDTLYQLAKLVADDVEQLWDEYRAAIIVHMRVDTPEIRAEVERARRALIEALDDSS